MPNRATKAIKNTNPVPEVNPNRGTSKGNKQGRRKPGPRSKTKMQNVNTNTKNVKVVETSTSKSAKAPSHSVIPEVSKPINEQSDYVNSHISKSMEVPSKEQIKNENTEENAEHSEKGIISKPVVDNIKSFVGKSSDANLDETNKILKANTIEND